MDWKWSDRGTEDREEKTPMFWVPITGRRDFNRAHLLDLGVATLLGELDAAPPTRLFV